MKRWVAIDGRMAIDMSLYSVDFPGETSPAPFTLSLFLLHVACL
jgi:hypothetical protein